MNQSLVLALFAFVVVGISFVRLLREREFFRLTAMKRAWGRVRGLSIYFVANVALPLVAGIVFLAQGITAFSSVPETGTSRELQLMQLTDLARISAQVALVDSGANDVPGTEYWHWGEFSQL